MEAILSTNIEGFRRRKRGDNPPTSLIATKGFKGLLRYQQKFMRDYNLSYPVFTVLFAFVDVWLEYGEGMSCYETYTGLGYGTGSHQRYYSIMENLIKKGLLEIGGTGFNHCKLYAPSSKALDIMGVFFEE